MELGNYIGRNKQNNNMEKIEEKQSELNEITKSAHYNNGVFRETFDIMLQEFGIEEVMSFCKLNAFKYRMRVGNKGQDEESIVRDVNKALRYEEKYREYYMTSLKTPTNSEKILLRG